MKICPRCGLKSPSSAERCDCGAALDAVGDAKAQPAPGSTRSAAYSGWARIVSAFAVVLIALGAAVHGGWDAPLKLGWSLLLVALALTVTGVFARRREPDAPPLRPYAIFLALPASILPPWAGWADSHNGFVLAFSIVLIVWAFFRGLIELTVGRLVRDWRTVLALALCLSYYWNALYSPCLGPHLSRFTEPQCFEPASGP